MQLNSEQQWIVTAGRLVTTHIGQATTSDCAHKFYKKDSTPRGVHSDVTTAWDCEADQPISERPVLVHNAFLENVFIKSSWDCTPKENEWVTEWQMEWVGWERCVTRWVARTKESYSLQGVSCVRECSTQKTYLQTINNSSTVFFSTVNLLYADQWQSVTEMIHW